MSLLQWLYQILFFTIDIYWKKYIKKIEYLYKIYYKRIYII